MDHARQNLHTTQSKLRTAFTGLIRGLSGGDGRRGG
jgi:hypothetical protein